MNERLTELYRQSRPKEALASQDEFKSANALLGSDVDRFAELLIMECARIADIETPNSAGCGYITKTKGDRIKEYFGVQK
jgi:hypothetical protein